MLRDPKQTDLHHRFYAVMAAIILQGLSFQTLSLPFALWARADAKSSAAPAAEPAKQAPKVTYLFIQILNYKVGGR
mgnify:CR=1 FL=1